MTKYIYIVVIVICAGCSSNNSIVRHNISKVLVKKEPFIREIFRLQFYINTIKSIDNDSNQILVLSGVDGIILDRNISSIKNRFPLDLNGITFVTGIDNSLFISVLGYKTGVLNAHGKLLFEYPSDSYFPHNHIEGGDLDNDGNIEFYIAARDGVHRVDSSGNRVWKFTGNFSGLSLYNNLEQKQNFIIAKEVDTTYSIGKFIYINHDGYSYKSFRSPIRGVTNKFVACNWSDNKMVLVCTSNRYIYVFDANMNILFKYNMGESSFAMRAVVFSPFYGKEIQYLAILSKCSAASQKTYLYIFSESFELIYAEEMDRSLGLAAISGRQDGERLLVGEGNSRLWQYSFEPKILGKTGGAEHLLEVK